MTDYTASGPAAPGTDAPSLSELLTAVQAMLAAAQASATAAAASATAAAAAETQAWLAPAITSSLGPVQSVFGRTTSNIAATFGDYSFSLLSGSVAPAQMPAFSGAITTSAGSTVATLSQIPNDTPCVGDLLLTNIAAPGAPSAGFVRFYALGAANKAPGAVNESATTFVMPQVQSLAAGQFVTGITANGAFTSASPASGNFSGLTGSASIAQMPADVLTAAIEFTISGGGSAIAAGLAPGFLQIPFPCTINSVTLLADQSGSITLDIWKCTYAQFAPGTHPVVGDSICAADFPLLNSAAKSTDSALTGWGAGKTINAGDVLAFNVKVAATNCTVVSVILSVTKT